MESVEISITISEVMEYLFCPRFIYFMNCLNIPQYEEKRYKVIMGREIHHEKKFINNSNQFLDSIPIENDRVIVAPKNLEDFLQCLQ